MTLSRKTRAVLIVVGALATLVWQYSLFQNWAEINKAYHQTYRLAGLGTQSEWKFVYFLYYANLFPVASTEGGLDTAFTEIRGTPRNKDNLDYSVEGAKRILEQEGSTLVTAWGGTIRDGELLQTFLYLPDAWRFGSAQVVEMRTANSGIFALGLVAMYASFTWWGSPLVGALLVLLIGSDPFQLYEVYARNNVFGWVIITFCWVLALTVPFMSGKKARRYVYWSAAILTGLLCGTVAHIRTEPLPILVGVGLVYLTSRALTLRGRLLALMLLIGTFLLVLYGWDSYFQRKTVEANAVVEKAGGHVYRGPSLTFHTAWDIVWMGLGDFDRKYGYEFKHQTTYAYASPILLQRYGERLPAWPPPDVYHDEARMYFRRPLDSARYFEVLREKVLHDISADPAWFGTILAKRLWRILNKTTPTQLQLGNHVLSIPFHGLLVIPLFAFLLAKRNWPAIQLLTLGATTSVSAFVLYSDGNWTCFGVYHICTLAVLLAVVAQSVVGSGTWSAWMKLART